MPFDPGKMEASHGRLMEKKVFARKLSIQDTFALARILEMTDLDSFRAELKKYMSQASYGLNKRQFNLFLDLCTFLASRKNMPAIPISSLAFGAACKNQLARMLTALCNVGLLTLVNGTAAFYGRKNEHNKACTYSVPPIAAKVFCRCLRLVAALDDETDDLNPIRQAEAQGKRLPEHLRKARYAQTRKRLARLRRECKSLTPEQQQNVFDRLAIQCTPLGIRAPRRYVEKFVREKFIQPEMWKDVMGPDSQFSPEYSTRIQFNIEYNKYGEVTRLGCRPYNNLCRTRNEEHSDERIKLLHELGIDAQHIDVKSSIWNVALAMKTGKFTPFKDQYAEFLSHLIPGWSEMSPEERKSIRNGHKVVFMQAAFGKYAEEAKNNPDGVRGNRILHGHTVRTIQNAMRTAGIEPFGKNTSVFLHEGAIYGIARKILIEEYGIRSICVYDSFYLDKKIANGTFTKILNKALHRYLRLLAEHAALRPTAGEDKK